MKHKRTYRFAAAAQLAAALLWVVTQTIMLSLPAIASADTAADGVRTIVICTGTGLETITLDPDGKPIKTPAKTIHCPWCAQFGDIGEIVANAISFSASEAVLIVRITLRIGGQFEGSTSATAFESRAPPLLAKM